MPRARCPERMPHVLERLLAVASPVAVSHRARNQLTPKQRSMGRFEERGPPSSLWDVLCGEPAIAAWTALLGRIGEKVSLGKGAANLTRRVGCHRKASSTAEPRARRVAVERSQQGAV